MASTYLLDEAGRAITDEARRRIDAGIAVYVLHDERGQVITDERGTAIGEN